MISVGCVLTRAAAATLRVRSRLGDAGEEGERLLGLTAGHQQLGETDDGVLVGGLQLQRRAVRTFGALGQQRGDGSLGLGRQQVGDELLDHVLGVGPDEAIDDLTVLQRVDRRNRLHLERLRDTRVLVDVDLDEDHFAVRSRR